MDIRIVKDRIHYSPTKNHVWNCVYVRIYMYVQLHTQAHNHPQTHRHRHRHTQTHRNTQTVLVLCVHTMYTHVHVHLCIYKQIHTWRSVMKNELSGCWWMTLPSPIGKSTSSSSSWSSVSSIELLQLGGWSVGVTIFPSKLSSFTDVSSVCSTQASTMRQS